eukprot:5937035-Ditylum_brightwellii.AAC.1
MEKCLDEIFDQDLPIKEKADAYTVRIYSFFFLKGEPVNAVDVGLEALSQLGVKFPKKISKLVHAREMVKTKYMLKGLRIMSLSDHPTMEDGNRLIAMNIMEMLFFTYTSDPALGMGDVEGGTKFGKVAMSILERFSAKDMESKLVLNLMGYSNDPTVLSGSVMQQEDLLKHCDENEDRSLRNSITLYRLWAAFYFEEFDLAATLVQDIQDISQTNRAPNIIWRCALLEGLTAFTLFQKNKSRKWKAHATKITSKVREW